MSQESISFFEDKTTEQIINWMIAHLSESQLRSCLDSAGISPGYSGGPSSSGAGPSSSGAGPSSSGAGSSSDPMPVSVPQVQVPQTQVPQFTPPVGSQIKPPRVAFNITPYIDSGDSVSARPINPVTDDALNRLEPYVGFQIESKEQIMKTFPELDSIGLNSVPIYIYNYEFPIVYFIAFVSGPTGLFVTAFQAPTLKIFKQIGFELLDQLNKSVANGQYVLPAGKTITKEMQRLAKVYGTVRNKPDIMTNTIQILTPDYVKRVRDKMAAVRAAKFGFSENYSEDLFGEFNEVDDYTGDYYTGDDYTENESTEDLYNFGQNDEAESDFGTEVGTEVGTASEVGTENNFEEQPKSSNMRVYDMDPKQLEEHMINKFGSKFANEYRAEKYVNSNGVPAVKYIKTGHKSNDLDTSLDTSNDGPIISGFGEDSEEENLF